LKTPLITHDFLLETQFARDLYHGHAAGLPIIDYHCHLPPLDVAEDRRWENLTQVWLYGDHYKWRAMRSNGVPERFCTGDASDREKFDRFAGTMPYLLRNPMYHWCHLELARYFDIDDLLLSPETAGAIWERTRARLSDPDMSARGLMKQSNVLLVCTTDDPLDALDAHAAVRADGDFDIQMLPTWRPDKGMAIDNPEAFNAWTDRLAAMTDTDIGSFPAFLDALRQRHEAFHAMGCRLSDHGIETVYPESCTDAEAADIFEAVRTGKVVDAQRVQAFKSVMMYHFGVMDSEKGWTQQIHYGALRNNNSRRFAELGPDSGFDSIGDWPVAAGLSRLLDRLDKDGALPKTILYTLNPRDNELVATMLGNFQDGSVPGKIQFGSGWWFNDQKDGMERHIEALSQLGLLRRFVGMLTDSRSFLSYTRHDYFRRILCNILGNDMEKGLIPRDLALVGAMVKDICYRNAATYFGFDLPSAA
jgi:glucuronate isomerase